MFENAPSRFLYLRIALLCSVLPAFSIPANAQGGTVGRPLIGSGIDGPAAAAGNRERVTVEPSIAIAYDSNVLRRDADAVAGSTDNVRYTPSLNLSYNRQIGRTQIRLAGSAGYDFNSRFRYLNRERLAGSIAVRSPVGAPCPVSLSFDHEQAQYELDELDTVASSVQTIQNITADASCTRPGLSPSLGTSYRIVKNSASSLSDSNYLEGHLGLRLNITSLGSVTIYGQVARLARPEFEQATGISDTTQMRRVYVSLSRAVAPRLQLTGNIGYLQALPQREKVPDFSGFSYRASVRYVFSPQVILNLSAMRDVENSTGISATYMVRRDLRTGLDLNVFHRTSLSFQAVRQLRRFVGNDLGTGSNIGSEASDALTVGITRSIGRRLRLGLNGGLLSRRADVELFDFDATRLGLSLSSRF